MPSRAQIQRLLDLEPNDPFILYAMATDHAKENEHREALEFFEKTIEADSDNCYAYYHMARSLEALHRIEEAKVVLDHGLEAAIHTKDTKGISEIKMYRTMLT